MSKLNVSILGKDYSIPCKEELKEHILKLSYFVDNKAKNLANSLNIKNDMSILIMASILLSDEILNLKKKINEQNEIIEAEKISNASENARYEEDAVDNEQVLAVLNKVKEKLSKLNSIIDEQ
jgi:cell division protein ZapA (FtsZ GTPase activity inhibitor)